ncbi:hypothetical protein F5B20DRAFT_538140 [Whalleya microplaca]|nr:hypothetical protein F5B20DRAFT_538140 [Whalleya microplaca]
MCRNRGGQRLLPPALRFLEPSDFPGASEKEKSTTIQFTTVDVTTPLTVSTNDSATPLGPGLKCGNESLTGLIDSHSVLRWHRFGEGSGYGGDGPLNDIVEGLKTKWAECWENSIANLHGTASSPLWGFERLPTCLGQKIFARIFTVYRLVGIRNCQQPECRRRRESLERAAPPCSWEPFRDLILTILSCWMPGFLWILHDIFYVENGDSWLPDDTDTVPGGLYDMPRFLCLRIDEVIDMYQWSIRVAYGKGFINDIQSTYETSISSYEDMWPKLGPIYEERAVQSTKQCRDVGICPNRIWNVSLLGTRAVADIPHIASIALNTQRPMDGQEKLHETCTDDLCLFSQTNSTLVKQLHRCDSGDCGEECDFPPHVLDKSFQNGWSQTAWRMSTEKQAPPLLCKPDDKYMAISHVWSDGTGAGLKRPGQVNRCLAEYFLEIASRLGCNGIWWDAISIPSGKDERRIAINQMLRNYEAAAVTLIHDQELVDLEWTDDGCPIVAIILSAWFTRGWTAAELFASRRHPVKFVFKDPRNPEGPPLLKDLDEDILAWDPPSISATKLWKSELIQTHDRHIRDHVFKQSGIIPRQGHFIATDIIKRLRGGNKFGISAAYSTKELDIDISDSITSTVRDLLLVLRARVTSWAKDRLLIPALMSLDPSEIDSSASGPQLTRQLLVHYKEIVLIDLFHGAVPLTVNGPWSWCPPSIFDLGMSRASLNRYPSEDFHIAQDGTLAVWRPIHAYSVRQDDIIVPVGTHPSVVARISVALRAHRDSCWLLTDTYQYHRQYLLVVAVWMGYYDNAVSMACRWIGCVSLGNTLPLGEDRVLPAESDRDCVRGLVNFGNDCDGDGEALPSMRRKSVCNTSYAYNRNTWVKREGMRWYITDGSTWNGKTRVPNYVPQPVCLYPVDVSEVAPSTSIVTEMSFCTARFDLERDEDTMDRSFLQSLPSSLNAKLADSGPDDESVVLAWSFPYEPSAGLTILRRIFRSTFRLIDGDPEDNELTIGRKTFEPLIRPYIRKGIDPTRKRRRKESNGDEEDEFITTCVQSDFADNIDWYKAT